MEKKEEEKKEETKQVKRQKRIYQIGLMLRRKPNPFILEFIAQNWGLKRSQAYAYIRAARKEWKKYFEKLEGDGIAYHVAQMRDLKDQAYSEKVVVGTVDNKSIVNVANLPLILEISKEEAKLMGIYPAEKHKEVREVIILGKKDRKKEEKDENK